MNKQVLGNTIIFNICDYYLIYNADTKYYQFYIDSLGNGESLSLSISRTNKIYREIKLNIKLEFWNDDWDYGELYFNVTFCLFNYYFNFSMWS